MEKDIKYIEKKLGKCSQLDTLEKFDFIISSVFVLLDNPNEIQLIKRILEEITSLRYEISYNRVLETSRLDRVLSYLSFKLARAIYNKEELIPYIISVLYYEKNEGTIKTLKQKIKDIEKGE